MEAICWLKVTDYMRGWVRCALGCGMRIGNELVISLSSIHDGVCVWRDRRNSTTVSANSVSTYSNDRGRYYEGVDERYLLWQRTDHSVAEIAQRGFLDGRRTIQRVVCPGTHRREICAGGNDRGVLQGNKDGRYVCGSHEKRVAEEEQEKKLAPIDIIEAIDTIEANANLHPRLQPHG